VTIEERLQQLEDRVSLLTAALYARDVAITSMLDQALNQVKNFVAEYPDMLKEIDEAVGINLGGHILSELSAS